MPIVHFGFWPETLKKWAEEGHISHGLAEAWVDGSPADVEIGETLGFDFNWYSCFKPNSFVMPGFGREVVVEFDDGTRHVRRFDGVIFVEKSNCTSIPAEVGYTLKDRPTWEKHYLPRLEWNTKRVTEALVQVHDAQIPFSDGGMEFLISNDHDYPYGLFCGSLFGTIRNILGLENVCYLELDDPGLFTEIVDTVGDLCFRCVEYVLKTGARFDFAHFWEDICFKNGPLIRPTTFAEKVGPHYKRITTLLKAHNIEIVSVDCDGLIDTLLPVWLDNGVNTMFPIEVGTWNASIQPWRTQYGRELRGVGGMNKTAFARDRAAVDSEVERLKHLARLGGYIPCPDHRIAPDAQWDLVCYYCERMRNEFSL